MSSVDAGSGSGAASASFSSGRCVRQELLVRYSSVSPVSVKTHSFCASLCLATQQRKLLSRPWCGVFRSKCSTCLLLRRSVFLQTPASPPLFTSYFWEAGGGMEARLRGEAGRQGRREGGRQGWQGGQGGRQSGRQGQSRCPHAPRRR